MLASRRALLSHASSFRYSYASYLSSISNKNLQFEASAAPKPEDLNQAYKAPFRAAEGGEVHKEREMRRRRKREDGREMAKAVAVGAIETGLELGRIGKQVLDGVWDAAEKTAHGIRDSIADDTDHNSGRHRRRVQDRSSDKFVEDLRRQDGGYDLNGRHRVEDRSSDKFVEDLRRRDGGGYDLNGRR